MGPGMEHVNSTLATKRETHAPGPHHVLEHVKQKRSCSINLAPSHHESILEGITTSCVPELAVVWLENVKHTFMHVAPTWKMSETYKRTLETMPVEGVENTLWETVENNVQHKH